MFQNKLIFILLFFSFATHANSNKDVELRKVKGEIKQLQNTILLDRREQENIQQELGATEMAISQLSQQVTQLNQSIIQEQKQLNQLKKSQQAIVNRLTLQHTALNKQLSSAYQLSQIQSLKIILNQNNPNTIQRHLTYYRYLTQARMQLITHINQTLSTLNVTLGEITQHQQNLKKLLTQKQTQQSQQKIAQNHRQQLLGELKQSMQSKEQQLSTLLANQKALYEIINRLQVPATSISALSFNQLRGKLHWPLPGKIASNYGSALDVGDQHLNGVIIKATQGTPIRAIFSGKVIFANWLRGFGLLIIINHGNNFMSLYGRNDTLTTRVGEHVRTGDVIATTGNSGGFDKSSLYFEIRQNGAPVDPNIWCS